MKKKTGAKSSVKPVGDKNDSPLALNYRMGKKTKFIVSISFAVLLIACCPLGVFAANEDPLSTINNLSDFIFGAIKAVGFIMLGFGIVQIGLSLKSHDASQRANGIMTFFGGVIIAFAKNILDLILA